MGQAQLGVAGQFVCSPPPHHTHTHNQNFLCIFPLKDLRSKLEGKLKVFRGNGFLILSDDKDRSLNLSLKQKVTLSA